MKTMIVSSLVVLAMAVSSFAFAGDRTSLTTLGMGRTAVSVSRGTDALGVNPANLAAPGVLPFVISLGQTDVRVNTELMSYDIYQKYFTGIDTGGGNRISYPLTDEDKNTIRSQMPDNPKTTVNVDEMYGGVSLQAGVLGSFGFGVMDHVGSTITLTRGYVDLFLVGMPANTMYNLDGTDFRAWWYREFNISYARKIPNIIPFTKSLYIGAGVKLIRGYGIFQMTKNHSSITNSTVNELGISTMTASTDFSAQRAGEDFFNNDDTTNAKFKPLPDPVGKGTGLDFGITAELNNGMIVSWSLTDIGSILWDKNVIETFGNGYYVFTGYSNDIRDSVKDVFKGRNQPGESFKTSLPTVMRLGVSMEAQQVPGLSFLPGHLLLAFEYAQGMNESLGNTTKPRFSLGTEYRLIPLLPLRTGLIMGGDDKTRWAFGFGLDFWVIDLDFATDTFGSLFSPKSFNALNAAVGMKIRL